MPSRRRRRPESQAAGQQAAQAQTSADNAVHRVDMLSDAVANLDNYHVVNEAAVHFGFNKDFLTKDAKDELDKLAADRPQHQGLHHHGGRRNGCGRPGGL